jgi:hypothetical protein
MLLPFVGVDSELHIHPTGVSRERWSPEARVREDAKRTLAEDHYRPFIMSAIEKLLPFVESRLLTIGSSDRGA